MINRENWQDVREYLAYLRKIGRDELTVRRVRTCLRHLIEWADKEPLGRARHLDPAFPAYLATARNDLKTKTLGAVSLKKICEYARKFFIWIRGEHPLNYRQVTPSWIETLRPSVAQGIHSEFKEHQFFTLEHLKLMAMTPAGSLREERDRAGACFMFLSAMRVGAFLSMPLKAVDLERLTVSQFPEMGVRTKNRKAARTHLLPIPELLAVVRDWDAKLRADGFGGNELWYAQVDRWNRNLEHIDEEPNWESRRVNFGVGLRKLCVRSGVPAMSSHKLRHGHAVFMMRRIKDMKQLKSLSQNLMHSSVGITDGTYGNLVRDDIADLYEGIQE